MPLRRVRGVLIRAVRRRPLALSIGIALAVPAAWIELSGRYAQWWVEGLSLILGATGVALVWAGLTGVGPDWIEPR
jgi:hypothetical protein